MNRIDRFSPPRLARLRYQDADFQILQEGEYVVCAVTRQQIPMGELRYWNVERQEAYASAAAAFQRYLSTRTPGA
jgi:hypothetical protein